MTAAETLTEAPPKRSRLPLILGVVLALAGAAGGFMATRLGILPFGADTGEASAEHGEASDDHGAEADDHGEASEDHSDAGHDDSGHAEEGSHEGEEAASAAASFVPLDPMIVNVDDPSGRRFLRFVAQMEAEPGQAAALESMKPRFSDVLNGYLRAVSLADLENPRALDLLRGQMLRRLQTVAGEGKIRDLLIIEFVLN